MVSGWARRTVRGPVDIDKEKRHTSTGWAHVWLIRHDVGIAVPWRQRDAFVFDQHDSSLVWSAHHDSNFSSSTWRVNCDRLSMMMMPAPWRSQ
jgi:hypothetical protein